MAYRWRVKNGRCDRAFLLVPCSNGERLCFSLISEDSCSLFVMEKSQDIDKIGKTPEQIYGIQTCMSLHLLY